MDYTQLTEPDVRHMLASIGVDRVETLFRDIPPKARLDRPLCLPAPLTELELLADLRRYREDPAGPEAPEDRAARWEWAAPESSISRKASEPSNDFFHT
jgi:hypothetical protein